MTTALTYDSTGVLVRAERDGALVLVNRDPASFDPGGVVFTDVPGSVVDGRNADFFEASMQNTGVNSLRYEVFGAPEDVAAAYESLSGSITVAAGGLDTFRATRDETTHRFFKVQVRRNAVGLAITYALREFAKGPG